MIVTQSMILLTLVASSVHGKDPCANMRYENRNQIDYGPLRFREVQGRAIDTDDVPVPGVCVGLFTGSDHRLIQSAQTDATGHFRFAKVSGGRYRLIATYRGFGAANAQILVGRGARLAVIRMRPVGIDTTS